MPYHHRKALRTLSAKTFYSNLTCSLVLALC